MSSYRELLKQKRKLHISASFAFFIIFVVMLAQTNCSTISNGLSAAAKLIDPSKAAEEAKKKAEEAEKEAQEPEQKEQKKGPQKLRVGFIPFDFSFDTGPASGKDAVQALAASMIQRGSFKPVSLKYWLSEEVNKVTAVNIQQIMERARATDIPIDSISFGRVFKAGGEYGLYVEIYPLIPGLEPTYYLRSFSNYSALPKIASEVVAEMEARAFMPRKPLFPKKIYVKSFNMNYYTYTNLRKGEGSIIQIPYLNVDGTSYKTEDNFFSSVLVYHLHSTRLFTVWNNNIKQYVQRVPAIPGNIDYILDIDMDISRTVNMLTVRVAENHTKNMLIFKYQYPFRSLEMQALNEAFRENVKIIVLHLLSDEEKKLFGVVNLDSIGRQKPVFCENYFLGYGRQYNLLFPSGASDLEVDGIKYKIFVSPFTMNNQIYDTRESYLLDLKK
jgi:hypothetical protein